MWLEKAPTTASCSVGRLDVLNAWGVHLGVTSEKLTASLGRNVPSERPIRRLPDEGIGRAPRPHAASMSSTARRAKTRR